MHAMINDNEIYYIADQVLWCEVRDLGFGIFDNYFLQVQMFSKLAKSRMFDLARFLKIVKKKLFAPNLSGNFYEETFF